MTDTTAGLPAVVRPARHRPTGVDIWFDDKLFARAQSIAGIMAKAAGFTPAHLIGKSEACFMIVVNSMDWKLSPPQVAQATYQTPGGKVGYEGKLCQAILENTGKFIGAPHYDYYGDWTRVQGKFTIADSVKEDRDGGKKKYARASYGAADEIGLGVVVRWRLKGELEPRTFDITLRQAYPRNSTLWATDPKTQLGYLAIRRFANIATPGVFMGLPFDHETDEMPGDRATDITPAAAEPTMDQFTGATPVVKDVDPTTGEVAGQVEPRFVLEGVDGDEIGSDDPKEVFKLYAAQIDYASTTYGVKGIEGWLETNAGLLVALEEAGAKDCAAGIRRDIQKLMDTQQAAEAPGATASDSAPSNEAASPEVALAAPAGDRRDDEAFWMGESLSINPRDGKGKPHWKEWMDSIHALIAAARTVDELDRLQKDNSKDLDGLHIVDPDLRRELMQAFTRRRLAFKDPS